MSSKIVQLLAACAMFAWCSRMAASSGTGEISDAAGETATVTIKDGDAPVVGQKANIFFNVPGTDVDVSVASGTVTSTENGAVKLKIDRATGTVSKGQKVKFSGGAAPPKPASARASPVESESPSGPTSTTDAELTPSPPDTTPDTAVPPPSPSPPLPLPQSPVSAGTQPPKTNRAAQFFDAGTAYYTAGKYDSAIVCYSNAIREAPDMAAAYLNRANAYLFTRNYRSAIADADKALQLNVSNPDDAYNIRGSAKSNLNDVDGAIADCNRALKVNPRNALAYNNRANDKLKKGDYPGALADCDKSISLDPNSSLPYYNRGYAYYDLAKYGAALADWKKAVAMEPSYAADLNPKIAQLESRRRAR